jgi:prepilin-type N-terminal cleavage/methylation domain-containing protein
MKRYTFYGFSLVELAIVLMIVALLLGGLMVPLNTQVVQGKINKTRAMQETLREALVGFALATGRLPCPAQLDLSNTNSNAGLEALKNNECACTTGSSSSASFADTRQECTQNSIQGTVPWVTLGLSETDAWNHRYTYRISRTFARSASKFTLTSSGNQDIVSASSGGNPVADNVPAVVVSHGKNGIGAYNPDGTQVIGSTGDEAENSDNDNTFIYHNQDETFDDLVTWVSPNVLFNRMVAAGKLP